MEDVEVEYKLLIIIRSWRDGKESEKGSE